MTYLKRYKYVIMIIITGIIISSFIIVKKDLEREKYNIEPVVSDVTITSEISEEEKPKYCTVDIKGAVNNPNTYTAECNKRVIDIIALANGLTNEADTSITNLAKNIFDEMVIIIYTKEEVAKMHNDDNLEQAVDNAIITSEDTNIVNSSNSDLVNINTAGINELKTLPGIGDAKAKAIIEYRNTYGIFKDISDIKKVNGIGDKLYESIKIYLKT